MTDTASNDRLTRFLIEGAGVRGVHVRLDDTWQQIRARADCPASAASWLGQAAAASALFTGHAKVDGRLSVQLRGQGTLRTLFAECTAAGTLRGIVQLAEDGGEVEQELSALHDAVLAITIENPMRGGRDPVRYQGLVALDSDTLAGAFEDYFVRSEQLPTRLLLAADENRAVGLMLQKLPGDEGDADGWHRTSALFDTLATDELLAVPVEELTHRLFHEDGARLLDDRPLSFACSCSRSRVESMLVSLGAEEARAAVQDDGLAQVRCEFCGENYRFDAAQIETLFSQADTELPPPNRLQ
ncbi:Hsp33 family molecular chaperone HslO [Cognatilysobacter bugurensis]|nr:Hsp33 family molecular chaperone HslO [Lysobacter bugurensis]